MAIPCPRCGKPVNVEISNPFCKKCKSPLNYPEPAQNCYGCGVIVPVHSNNCPNCGKPIIKQPLRYQEFPSYQSPQTVNPVPAPTPNFEALLANSINLVIPSFIDAGGSDEIIVELNNSSNIVMKNISLDLSDMKDFFKIEGRVAIPALRPGMHLRENIRIKPKFKEGTFPIKIRITSVDAAVVRECTIKVGGTEIY